MVVHAEIIRNCVVELARQVIRLYAQFTAGLRAVMLTDKYDKLRTYYVDRAALCSDDVFLENENELLYSRRQKRDALMNVYTSGLLGDENGEIRPATKEKLLALFGFKDLDYRKGISRLQEEKAQSENDIIRKSGLSIEEIDDDGIHIDEHERYILSEYGELMPDEKQRLFAHIRAHKERLNKIKGENV